MSATQRELTDVEKYRNRVRKAIPPETLKLGHLIAEGSKVRLDVSETPKFTENTATITVVYPNGNKAFVEMHIFLFRMLFENLEKLGSTLEFTAGIDKATGNVVFLNSKDVIINV